MASLETILRELRDFRRENSENLNEIKEDIRAANNRIDEAERRIMEAEERLQWVEDATLELLELQKRLEDRVVDQEGRARRENIRIYGVREGAEDSAESMIDFIENLLREKLALPLSLRLQIQRAHRAPTSRPPPDSPPRSIVSFHGQLQFRCLLDNPQWAKCVQQAQNFEDSQVIILAAAGQRDNGVDYRQDHQQTIHGIPGRAAVGLLAKHQTVSQDLDKHLYQEDGGEHPAGHLHLQTVARRFDWHSIYHSPAFRVPPPVDYGKQLDFDHPPTCHQVACRLVAEAGRWRVRVQMLASLQVEVACT
ncbi:hypothetical protein D9C73_020269 [Collichthys lucidus]|uniref:Uncharacterized protein n=1 Tax=Collichthys lucidus TaxID=240159 RepID=A0A4V6ARX4_COLLU|nr:hypothetical protein D9C73_020269 [Collichthys lucidus]